MITMDVFKQDAFSVQNLSAAVDKVGFEPGFLGSIPGLFDPVPVRSEDVWIEGRGSEPALIQTSPRGAPPARKSDGLRDARAFKTRRLALASTIRAAELLGIRAFGSESELKAVATEVARRQFLLKRDHNVTIENLKLGCVQGVVKDADGSTIYDWASEFSQSIPAEVDFDLDNASPAAGAVRKKCNAVIRSITKNLKLANSPNVSIMAICGSNFFDDLTTHPEVERTFLNWAAATDLRSSTAWKPFRFGDIDWVEYRGTDDGTTVAVNTDKARFFPVGAGIFKWVMAPGEGFEHIGTVGQEFYSNMVLDQARNQWADVEVYSYPLPVCTMPGALYQGKRT